MLRQLVSGVAWLSLACAQGPTESAHTEPDTEPSTPTRRITPGWYAADSVEGKERHHDGWLLGGGEDFHTTPSSNCPHKACEPYCGSDTMIPVDTVLLTVTPPNSSGSIDWDFSTWVSVDSDSSVFLHVSLWQGACYWSNGQPDLSRWFGWRRTASAYQTTARQDSLVLLDDSVTTYPLRSLITVPGMNRVILRYQFPDSLHAGSEPLRIWFRLR